MMKEDWIEIELGDAGKIVSGGTPSTSNPVFWGHEISWITPADLSGYTQKYISKGRKSISVEGLNKSSARLMPANSVLFSSRAPIGYTVIARNELCTNQGFKSLIPKPFLNSEFVYYYFNSIKAIAEKNASGTTFKELSGKAFAALPIKVPPLPEQRAIVSKIEQLFSELDNGIANLQAAKEKLDIYRQAVLKKAFEGELTREWRERQVDHVNDIKENQNHNQIANHIPQGWKLVKTGEVLESINNGYTPKRNFLTQDNGEIPFIKVYNLQFDGTLNFTKNPTFIPRSIHEKELKRSICIPGDVLINIVGPPLGKVSIVPNLFPQWNINQAIVRFRPNQKVQSIFLSYFLQNLVTIHWLEGTSKATAGQYNVKVTTCREIPMLLPPLEEQHQIVQEIESRLSVCDNLLANIDEALEKAEALRQSILKKAFEGKLLSAAELEACKKEPDWEPAQKLLERIKKIK